MAKKNAFVLFLICSCWQTAFATRYYFAKFSCSVSATKQTIESEPVLLNGKINFEYTAVFHRDLDTRSGLEWFKIAKLADTAGFPLQTGVVTGSYRTNKNPESFEDKYLSVPKVGIELPTEKLSELLKKLGEVEIDSKDPFTPLISPRSVKKEGYFNPNPPYGIEWSHQWGMSLPPTFKLGLIYLLSLECRGSCTTSNYQSPTICPGEPNFPD